MVIAPIGQGVTGRGLQLPPNASPPVLKGAGAFRGLRPNPSSRFHRPLARGWWCFWGPVALRPPAAAAFDRAGPVLRPSPWHLEVGVGDTAPDRTGLSTVGCFVGVDHERGVAALPPRVEENARGFRAAQ